MDNLSIITSKFGNDYKNAAHNEITFNCPFCADKRGKVDTDHKLYVNTKSLKFHCFKCNSSGRLKDKFVQTDVTNSLYKKILQMKNPDYVDEDDIDTEDEDNMFYLPVSKIEKGTVAYNYCLERGITPELMDYYDIRLGVGDLVGRIVIPNVVYNNCWTDMYSARTVINQIPKYKNPVGAQKNKLVFNINRIRDGQGKVIICEGVITAICGGKDCVAVYGCHPSKEQLDQILRKNPKSIYCCLDGDEAGQSGMLPTLQYLYGRCSGSLYSVKMPEDRDACDMGYDAFREYVEKYKVEYDGVFSYRLSKFFATNG